MLAIRDCKPTDPLAFHPGRPENDPEPIYRPGIDFRVWEENAG
jgi:hypothetical protein